ncbi:hypothetical protein [Hymenobacter psoromatis]|uniref:hypothetical protein n=1 Tax=Hymenobacter psoromatis TaxID=1484116 RepID=UPI001CC1A36D|nr:hypothetical protein [Hymenobacter psoromatis]
MFRFRLLLIALLGTSLQLAAAPAPDSITWKRVALPARASVELPTPFTTMPASDPNTQANFANTSEATYVAACALIDSTAYPYSNGRLTLNELAAFYAVNIKALIGDEAQARLLRRTPFALAGYQGVEVELSLPATASLGGTKFARILYANHRAYMLTWRATLGQPASEVGNRRHFFQSLQVKAAPAAEREVSDVRQAGRTTGRLLVYGAVIATIIMLVRRFRSTESAK